MYLWKIIYKINKKNSISGAPRIRRMSTYQADFSGNPLKQSIDMQKRLTAHKPSGGGTLFDPALGVFAVGTYACLNTSG